MELKRREVKCSPELIKFMFPEYEVINDDNIPIFPIRPAIYVGSLNMREVFLKKYEATDLDFIVVSPNTGIDLTDRRQLVQVGFEKWKRTVPQYLAGSGKELKYGRGYDMGIIDKLDQDEFMFYFKYHWVTGKWLKKKATDENTFLELITSINSSKVDFMRRFFEVVNDTRPYRIESSIMTFLLRAKYKNYKGISSSTYKSKVKSFEGKRVEEALESLNKTMDNGIENYTLRLLVLLMNIIDNIR